MASQFWSLITIADEQNDCIQCLKDISVIEVEKPELHGLVRSSSASQCNSTYDSLLSTEISCRKLIDDISLIILSLNMLSDDYNAVTSRSNALMKTCEDLLEQQVSKLFEYACVNCTLI